MSNDDSSAVVIGALAIGAAFVIVLSILPLPDFKKTDENEFIKKANNLKETQVFLSEYPNSVIAVERFYDEIEGNAVTYSHEKIYDAGRVETARLFVLFNSITRDPASLELDCAIHYVNGFGGISTGGTIGTEDISQALKSMDCAK